MQGYTGFPGGSGQQSQQNSFNAVANMPPPQQQQAPDKFAPSNIFAAMKKTEFGKPEDERPQDASESLSPPFDPKLTMDCRQVRLPPTLDDGI